MPFTGPEAALATAVAAMRAEPRSAYAALPWVGADGALGGALGSLDPAPLAYDSFSRATVHRRSAGEAPAVDEFIRLEAAGWKGRAGTALASDPDHARFLRDAAARFAARGSLQLLFLEAGGRVAAAHLSFRAGGADFCFKVVYDETPARFSPGRELELRLLDRFEAGDGPAWMDSRTDSGNELFNRLWPDRRAVATLAYRSPGPLGRSARPGLRAMAALRDLRRRRRAAVD